MRDQFGKIAIGCVLAVAGMASAAYPQAAAPTAPNGSVVVASPTYTSIPTEIIVNRPAAEMASNARSMATSGKGSGMVGYNIQDTPDGNRPVDSSRASHPN
jgi:hypothetical protein